jgi:paraquat-inducible protein B
MSSSPNDSTDHGEVVPPPRFRLSWAWLFPLLAAIAASWMFYSNWKSNGSEIEIEFTSAPGMHAGKTSLIYRGVVAGTVSNIRLAPSLDKVLVTVRLKAFAENLAREGTTFWIEQPVISLSQASGIESLIDGNSIQAVLGDGRYATHFKGSDKIPIAQEGKSHFRIKLTDACVPLLDRGSPVYFRGMQVGIVSEKYLDENNETSLTVLIDQEYVQLLRSNARFWYQPPTSVKLGAGILKLDFNGLKSMLFGSICFDVFGGQGVVIPNGSAFPLCSTEAEARATSSPLRLVFSNGQGLLAGSTQVRYLGTPVGIVEKVETSEGKVVVTARLESGYDFLRRKGSLFSVIRPTLELQKVTGLETLVSGIYIDCIPDGGGSLTSHFQGTPQEEADLIHSLDDGFEVIIQSPSTKIGPGANILYRGVIVGKVIRKSLSTDGRSVNLYGLIDRSYAPLLRENTKFWNAGGVKISGGLISLRIQAPALEARGLEGIQFATPGDSAMGDQVKQGHVFELFDSPRREWLQWAPAIPIPRN